MFGSKLKTWMENHIGRPRRKAQEEKGKSPQNNGRGVILESSESLAQSDTGISSGSQQVLTSSTTDNREGYCTTTMESDRSGMTHCRTAVSLPSPESAYSTGYSTDGASPAGTGPPEYYINIRTGKHYFPSPAPTPTSPQPNSTFSNMCFLNGSMPLADSCLQSTSMARVACPQSSVKILPVVHERKPNTAFGSAQGYSDGFGFSKSPSKKPSQLSSLKFFLKSPRQEKGKLKTDVNKTPVFENKKKVTSPGKNKKWYKQPFQKFGCRRTDSPEHSSLKNDLKKDTCYLDRNIPYLLTKENTASPRQRNRIKTNPWLPTEPMSSQNFQNLQINFSPSLLRNRSCTNTPLQNRKTNEVETIQNRIKQMSMKYDESKEYLNDLEKAVARHIGKKLHLELSDHSEEDLTLNEMMGTFNESYVYEKETDILSDSDPTDCEDYVSDSEANNGGDEQDSHDDELDYIDNGSVAESEEHFQGNTGKCTYHDMHAHKNSFLYKCDRHHSRKGSDSRKSFRRDQESVGRRSKDEKRRRPARKSFKNEEVKKPPNDNVGGLSLSKILAQKIITKNVSKSADGTPVIARRQKLRETRIGNDEPETKCSIKKQDLLLIDSEADRKYNELIKEAENMFESMNNSPVIQARKNLNPPRKSSEPLNTSSKGEVASIPVITFKSQEAAIRKSPKHLGLKLPVEESSKRFKKLDLETDKKSLFKAKSSAHSPLDPLGPTFRNFSVFKPKISSSSSEDSEPLQTTRLKAWDFPEENEKVLGSPIVPIAFQSVDLGKPLTSYCPQSEPVKRKIYSCSKTYDKLVKRFENNSTVFEEKKTERSRHGSLASRRRTELESGRARLAHSARGNQGVARQHREARLAAEEAASPRPGLRRASMPGSTASPRVPHRHTLDVEVFR